MRKVEAWQASDGIKFFTEAECRQHEEKVLFSAWYYLRHHVDSDSSEAIFKWLQENAEDIRGFLPPVAAKPALNVDDLAEYIGGSMKEYPHIAHYVHVNHIVGWLGELE